MEDWKKELDKEMSRRHKEGEFLSFTELSKRFDVYFASWSDYHDGDSRDMMEFLGQLDIKHSYELGHFICYRGPKRRSKEPVLGTGYFFVYSKEKLSPQKLNKIKYHLGIDLAKKYNIDDWNL